MSNQDWFKNKKTENDEVKFKLNYRKFNES